MSHKIIYKEESYEIIGICTEVHRILGKGHSEDVYKDALEYEFQQAGITFSRETQNKINYKDIVLPHHYYADFVAGDKIILGVKAIELLTSSHIKPALNYLAVSNLNLGLLVNFGRDSMEYQRVVL